MIDKMNSTKKEDKLPKAKEGECKLASNNINKKIRKKIRKGLHSTVDRKRLTIIMI